MGAVRIPEEILRKSPAISEALDREAANEADYASAKLAVRRVRGERRRLIELRDEISTRAASLVQRYAGGAMDEEIYREQLTTLGAEAAAADAVLQQMPALEGWADSRMTAASKAKLDYPAILGKIGALEGYLCKIKAGEAVDFHRARVIELAGYLELPVDEVLRAAGIDHAPAS
jgi:hypothetical protein